VSDALNLSRADTIALIDRAMDTIRLREQVTAYADLLAKIERHLMFRDPAEALYGINLLITEAKVKLRG